MYYYLYIVYTVALALWVAMDSPKHGMKRWWALLVLTAPVTAIAYVAASRSKAWKKPVLILLGSMIAASVVGVVLEFYPASEPLRFSHMSPAAEEMVTLSTQLKECTDKLDEAIKKLEELSRVQSKLDNMGQVLRIIGEMKVLIIRHNNAEITLIQYAENYRAMLKQEKLDWLLSLKTYYENRVVVLQMDALKDYLYAFEDLLNYIIVNFREIEERNPKQIHNYDALYLNYRRAVDRHNAVNIRRVQFQDKMLKTIPELKPYLPSIREVKLIF